MNDERYKLALSFWTASFQYLMLVENVAHETASQGNVWVMVRDFNGEPISPNEYEEGTRWSDHTIIIPLLFNLLHGIELLVKGFLLVDPTETIEKQHDITDLCTRLKAKYPDQDVLLCFLNKYTDENHMPELLKRFLAENNVTVNGLYQALRYPSPDFTTMRTYASLKYHGEDGTSFFDTLHHDIKGVRVAAVSLGRGLGNQEGGIH